MFLSVETVVGDRQFINTALIRDIQPDEQGAVITFLNVRTPDDEPLSDYMIVKNPYDQLVEIISNTQAQTITLPPLVAATGEKIDVALGMTHYTVQELIEVLQENYRDNPHAQVLIDGLDNFKIEFSKDAANLCNGVGY